MQTKRLPEIVDTLAPDGSQIRVLVSVRSGSMAHCTLPPGQTSQAVTHRTADEVWYFLAGKGEVWRQMGKHQETIEVTSGLSLSIPVGTRFQFRNLGDAPLEFVLVTMPPWPGEHEARPVRGCWPPTTDRP